MSILQLASAMPGNYGYSLKLLPVLHHRRKRALNSVNLKLWKQDYETAIRSGEKKILTFVCIFMKLEPGCGVGNSTASF